jgi:hypothetical protein
MLGFERTTHKTTKNDMGIMAIVYQIVQWHMILFANNLARELLTTLHGDYGYGQGYVVGTGRGSSPA